MKKVIGLIIAVSGAILLAIFGWLVYSSSLHINTSVLDTNNTVASIPASGPQLLFTVNTQEFIYSEESEATLNKIIDLHEQLGIPVDIYLDHAIFQVYEDQAPDLLQRLKTSPMVAVSYHIRPPLPYANNFDFLDLAAKSPSDIKATIQQYETHAIDFSTGEVTADPGGYQHLKDYLGYAPPIVGLNTEPQFAQALVEVYQEMGATFGIEHRGSAIALGEERLGLPLRPEDVEIILTEYAGQPCSTILSTSYDQVRDQEVSFVNVKVHDNDFIATRSAWLSIYLPYNRPTLPPFDLSLGQTNRELLSEDEQTTFWDQYAGCVQYAAEHPEQFNSINAFDLQMYLEAHADSGTASPVSTNVQTESDQPTIHVSVVSHVEEPNLNHPDFVEDEGAFWRYRQAILHFAQMLSEHDIPYNFQSDWNFLLAMDKYDQGTGETNGKNLIQYLYEDLGVEIDPHAHQTEYNYADVAYLIQQLGVQPTGVVGGYLVLPLERSELDRFYQPIQGAQYDYSWKAEILWGGGSPNHTQDYTISGVWKPKGPEAFTEHDDQASLPTIGTYSSDWEGVQDLLQKAEQNELDSSKLYTASVMAGSDVFLDDQAVAEFESQIEELESAEVQGRIQFVLLEEVIEIWENVYNSQPNIYREEGGSFEEEAPVFTNSGKCGNGICETIERQLNRCPEDC